MHSCLYAGTVRHRRFSPVVNQFKYSLFQLYLDLSELPEVFDPYLLWSARRPALAWFRREDHLGDPAVALDVCVRDEVERQTGLRPGGPIRLLTNLRYFGYVINPVSYYYCFDERSGRLQTVLAEVHNTPWGERHCYVLNSPVDRAGGASSVLWNEKEFHVSPFMEMGMRYRWQLSEPAESLAVSIQCHEVSAVAIDVQPPQGLGSDNVNVPSNPGGEVRRSRPFDVTLSMRRQEITDSSLRRVLLSHPCMTASVTARIYWQALRLWWKQVPFVPHPRQRRTGAIRESSTTL
jgi:DUF1365 family protein